MAAAVLRVGALALLLSFSSSAALQVLRAAEAGGLSELLSICFPTLDDSAICAQSHATFFFCLFMT